MNIEELHEYAISKPGSEDSFPFGNSTLVFKVNNKIFLLVSIDANPIRFNAKCDPEKAIELREQYECITPGYHMNKKHWNSVLIDGTLTHKQLKAIIDDSYNLVAKRK